MKYEVKDGIIFLDSELSYIEHSLFRHMENNLFRAKYKYLSIPSSITKDLVQKQDINLSFPVLGYSSHDLSGSAEQGILQYFENKEVTENFYFSKNQCFRSESEYFGPVRLKEFVKLEQFCFSKSENAEYSFEKLMYHATSFLNFYYIKHRVVDVTKTDIGYHKKKYDIEIDTKQYGWVETHSCSSFGQEQSKRFNITGDNYTISNTGIASPRILIPFIEDPDKIHLLIN